MMIKIGDFRLAPRPRYVVEKEEININLTDNASNNVSGGDCGAGDNDACGNTIKNREIIFQVTAIGNGDPEAATRNYLALQEFLGSICASAPQEYYRQIWTETPRQFDIVRAYIKDIDLNLEYLCEGIRRGEVHLITADQETGTEIAIYGYTVNKAL